MRYIKRPSISSENKENLSTNQSTRQQLQQYKKQLKISQNEITILRQQNNDLRNKLQIKQKQQQAYLNLKDQVQFLRQREHNVKRQMDHYQEINRKLRQQLQKSQRQRIKIEIQLKNLQQNQFNRQINKVDYKDNHLISDRFVTKRDKNSHFQSMSIQKSQKMNSSTNSYGSAKQNHYSTPKSKVKINLEQFIPENNIQKRKMKKETELVICSQNEVIFEDYCSQNDNPDLLNFK